MTTICTDSNTMAGDTLMSSETERCGTLEKVTRTTDGRIVGVAGLATECIMFQRWIEEQGEDEKPILSDDFEALVLTPSGEIHWYDHRLVPVTLGLHAAIGSGAKYAIGAMLAGASPHDAVDIASWRDLRTGKDITVLERTMRNLEAA